MTDLQPDDPRLRTAEERMRHALGLHGDTPRQSATDHPTTMTHGSHPQKCRFVRDGEVPVTVIHRDHRQDDTSGANQLDAARQAIRSQAAARERAERLLTEAQITTRTLQTKLAHERLAKDEAILRAEAEKQARQTVQAELLAERTVRGRLGRSMSDAEATIQDLQRKLDGARAELATERRARQNAEGSAKCRSRHTRSPHQPTVVKRFQQCGDQLGDHGRQRQRSRWRSRLSRLRRPGRLLCPRTQKVWQNPVGPLNDRRESL